MIHSIGLCAQMICSYRKKCWRDATGGQETWIEKKSEEDRSDPGWTLKSSWLSTKGTK